MAVETLITLLEHTQVFRYVNIASIALLYYDYCLTLSSEVDVIWPSKWNLIKILFVLVRYTPFFDSAVLFYHHFAPHVSPESCFKAYTANGWLFYAGGALAEMWTATAIIIAKFITSLGFAVALYPGFRGCMVLQGSSLLSVVWILLMVFNGGRMGVTSDLLKIVYRDGITYYFYLFGATSLAMP
ncbi:hypothetical protein BDQ17DRAFT_1324022 [Cyathus striatus]|nr:hypothetical protein BDQ17DRAFT_1324022 [Cyathus striatus]